MRPLEWELARHYFDGNHGPPPNAQAKGLKRSLARLVAAKLLRELPDGGYEAAQALRDYCGPQIEKNRRRAS